MKAMKLILSILVLATSPAIYAQTFTIAPGTPAITCSSSTEGQTGIVIPAVAFTCFNQHDTFLATDGSKGTFECCNVAGFDLAIPGTDQVKPYTCYGDVIQTVTKVGTNTYQFSFTCDVSPDGSGTLGLSFTASYAQTHKIVYRWPWVVTTWTINQGSVALTLD